MIAISKSYQDWNITIIYDEETHKYEGTATKNNITMTASGMTSEQVFNDLKQSIKFIAG